MVSNRWPVHLATLPLGNRSCPANLGTSHCLDHLLGQCCNRESEQGVEDSGRCAQRLDFVSARDYFL